MKKKSFKLSNEADIISMVLTIIHSKLFGVLKPGINQAIIHLIWYGTVVCSFDFQSTG